MQYIQQGTCLLLIHYNMLTDEKITLDRIVRFVFSAAVLVCLFLLIKRLSGVLLPFLVSWLIAYMLFPIVRFFQYTCRFKYRMPAIITTLVLLLGLIAGIFAIVVPMISEEASKLSLIASEYLAEIKTLDFLPAHMQSHYKEWLNSIDLEYLMSSPDVMDIAKKISPHVWNVVSGSANVIVGLSVIFICVLYIVFILLDFEKLSQWSDLIPEKYRNISQTIAKDIEVNMNRYFRGQALVALCVGILFAIGFKIIGLPLGIVTGLFIGLLNLVPYLQVVGIIPCVMLGILQAAETGRPIWLVFLLIAVVFIIVQSLQDFVLTPKIMGNVTGLHPAIILLALSIWGSLLGVVGMIIALPLTTIILSYYKRFVLRQ